MTMTSAQEDEFIEKNKKKISSAVDNFIRRCSSNVIRVPREDMVQEASIALLLYARKCETEEDLEKFPIYSVQSALRDLIFDYQPFACPHSTHRFSEICSAMPRSVSFDVLPDAFLEVDGMANHWVDDKETEIDFDIFMSEKSDSDQRLVGMKMCGGSLRNLAKEIGISKDAVKRTLDKLHTQYSEFIKGDEENEL